jgi:hypothetical protein
LERPNLDGELMVLRKEEVVALSDLSVESTIVDPFQAEAADGIHGVTEKPKAGSKAVRHILVEQKSSRGSQ